MTNSSGVWFRDHKWLTAKLVSSSTSRIYIGRLELLGYDYWAVLDGPHVRILVRREQLDDVLELFRDLSHPTTSKAQVDRRRYRQQIRLLVAIPLGMLTGSLLTVLVDVQSMVIPCAAAAIAGLFAYALPHSLTK